MKRTDEVQEHIENDIGDQIRALLNQKGWTQEELAYRAGMNQSTISELMKPGSGARNLKTLARLARAFECGIVVQFVSSKRLSEWRRKFDPDNFML